MARLVFVLLNKLIWGLRIIKLLEGMDYEEHDISVTGLRIR